MGKSLIAFALLVGSAVGAQEDWQPVRGSDTLFETETIIKSIKVQSEGSTPRIEIQLDTRTVRAGRCPDSDSVYIEERETEMLDSAKLAQALKLRVRVVVDDSKEQILAEASGSFRCALVGITVLSEVSEESP